MSALENVGRSGIQSCRTKQGGSQRGDVESKQSPEPIDTQAKQLRDEVEARNLRRQGANTRAIQEQGRGKWGQRIKENLTKEHQGSSLNSLTLSEWRADCEQVELIFHPIALSRQPGD